MLLTQRYRFNFLNLCHIQHQDGLSFHRNLGPNNRHSPISATLLRLEYLALSIPLPRELFPCRTGGKESFTHQLCLFSKFGQFSWYSRMCPWIYLPEDCLSSWIWLRLLSWGSRYTPSKCCWHTSHRRQTRSWSDWTSINRYSALGPLH